MNPLIREKSFVPGKDWVWYAPNMKDIYGATEIQAVTDALTAGWLTTGPITKTFEDKIADLFGKKHGLFVNSGSSANLLALEACRFPKGSEVITPACNFNTTVAPIVQLGLTPVFIDVKEGFYTLDAQELEKALTKKTVAIMAPHLIGNLIELDVIHAFAREHGLVVIEDSCDTIGTSYAGKKTGSYSDITTTSFYSSHLVTTGGAGGMVMVNNARMRETARVFRDWGRGISKHDDKINSRLSTFSIQGKPYDSAFVFVERGYNMRPTEMQAAFGLAQLARLNSFLKTRTENFSKIRSFLSQFEDRIILPEHEPKAVSHWLAFPITFRKNSGIDRNAFARYLESNKIQTRPLFSGNIVKHPAYKGVGRSVGSLPKANHILRNSLLIGAHHGMTKEMREYVCEKIETYLKKNGGV